MTKTRFTLLLAIAAGLLMTVDSSQAGLGWSFDECVQHYGQITEPNIRLNDGEIECDFCAQGYVIWAYFITNTVSRIVYISHSGFDNAGVADFLTANGPGAVWEGPERDASSGSYRWNGTVNGAYAYSASLHPEDNSLIIWTKEDNDFGAARHTERASGL